MNRIFILSFSIVIAVFSVHGLPKPQETGEVTTEPPQQYNEWKAAWGNLKSAFRNVGNWFTRQYRNVRSWFATTKQELEKKVGDMVNFLGTVKNNSVQLIAGAGQELNNALQNVNTMYNDALQFQTKMRMDVQANFETLEDEWQRKVQSMYNSGLDEIVKAAEASKMNMMRQQRVPVVDGSANVTTTN